MKCWIGSKVRILAEVSPIESFAGKLVKRVTGNHSSGLFYRNRCSNGLNGPRFGLATPVAGGDCAVVPTLPKGNHLARCLLVLADSGA